MSKFTVEEIDAILARSAELLSYDLPDAAPIAEPEPLTHDQIVQRAMAEPLETRNQRVTRELAERDALLVVERAENGIVHKTYTPPPAANTTTDDAWNVWVKSHIANALDENNAFRNEVLVEVIAEQKAEVATLRADFERRVSALEAEVKTADAVNAAVKDALDKMEHAVDTALTKMVAELHKSRGGDDKGVIELPDFVSPRPH